jgi:hypothetical protein
MTDSSVSGLDWVITQAVASGKPSVVSMSLGGSASRALDRAVEALTSAGIHIAVSAGNKNDDASNYSPSRAPSAITVGASTIEDSRASFSNYGTPVDIFAPGQDVISAWNTDDTVRSISYFQRDSALLTLFHSRLPTRFLEHQWLPLTFLASLPTFWRVTAMFLLLPCRPRSRALPRNALLWISVSATPRIHCI